MFPPFKCEGRTAIALCALFLCSLLAVPAASAEADGEYLHQLLERARSKQLWTEPTWLRLLHYEPSMLVPWSLRSAADDPAFFNSPRGAVDARAELESTLRAFFADQVPYDNEREINPHAQCRFAARLSWLKGVLRIDQGRLPSINCPRLEEWLAALDPRSMALIFPSSYVNNPASAFGHTLLRIDGAGQDEQTRLLAYAVNYAANTGDDGGLLFMFKGVIGGYPGVFSVAPYYQKINEYNDVENRDVWEYELDFSPEEIRQILRHVWELRYTHFDYYFFDENCSYHLLSLFEVVRPELHLTNDFRAYTFSGWVIPPDTVRAVTSRPGLLRKVTYRPALSTQLHAWDNAASSEEKQLAKDVAEGAVTLETSGIGDLPPERRAAVYELAFDYLNYRRLAVENEKFASAGLGRELLRRRSEIDLPKLKPDPLQPAIRPDTGHKSRRISLRGGYDSDRWFYELQIRPAFHDLLDPRGGYSQGAQIDFFDTALRAYEDRDLELQYFVPVRIISLAPRTEFVSPISWNLETALTRKRFGPERDELIGRIAGGPGLAYEAGSGTAYGFAQLAFEYGDEYEQSWNAAGGLHAGSILDLAESTRLFAFVQLEHFVVGGSYWDVEAGAGLSHALTRNLALRLDVSRHRELDHYWTEAAAMISFYF